MYAADHRGTRAPRARTTPRVTGPTTTGGTRRRRPRGRDGAARGEQPGLPSCSSGIQWAPSSPGRMPPSTPARRVTGMPSRRTVIGVVGTGNRWVAGAPAGHDWFVVRSNAAFKPNRMATGCRGTRRGSTSIAADEWCGKCLHGRLLCRPARRAATDRLATPSSPRVPGPADPHLLR